MWPTKKICCPLHNIEAKILLVKMDRLLSFSGLLLGEMRGTLVLEQNDFSGRNLRSEKRLREGLDHRFTTILAASDSLSNFPQSGHVSLQQSFCFVLNFFGFSAFGYCKYSRKCFSSQAIQLWQKLFGLNQECWIFPRFSSTFRRSIIG